MPRANDEITWLISKDLFDFFRLTRRQNLSSYFRKYNTWDVVGWLYKSNVLSTQNEGGLAHLPVRNPLGALEGGPKDDSPGDFWVLGGYASKASSYH